jgi:hypothetical protein
MKIESVPLTGAVVEGKNKSAKVVLVKFTGNVDRENRVLQLARRMLQDAGSKEDVKNFDVGMSTGMFRSDK